MRLGIDVAQHRLPWPELLERVRYGEDAGFEGAWLFDHFTPHYGQGPGPCVEAWTAIAALAASTSRIRLGTLVTGMTHRHPSVFATQVVTADHVSGGRIELAVGASWNEAEHRTLGLPFPPRRERVDRFEEGLEVLRLLMTTEGASFDGRHFQLRDATYLPRPVQQPHPPLWIGASGERRMLPLVGRRADAWHAFGDARRLAQKWAVVERHAEEAGRDPSSITRATSLSLSEPWDEVRRRVDALREVGVSYLVCNWPAEGRSRLDEFVEALLPELSAS